MTVPRKIDMEKNGLLERLDALFEEQPYSIRLTSEGYVVKKSDGTWSPPFRQRTTARRWAQRWKEKLGEKK